MQDLISPKYQMKLVKSVETAIWEQYRGYRDVRSYIANTSQYAGRSIVGRSIVESSD